MANKKYWDKEKIYDEQIYPLMDQIIKICKDNSIPMHMIFKYANKKDEGPMFCRTSIPTDDCDQTLERIASFARELIKPSMFMETHVTNTDGSKVITISKV